jgi:hypothetical protein
MRAVEGRFSAFMQNSNSGTATLDDLAARSFEEGFYSPPFNIDELVKSQI